MAAARTLSVIGAIVLLDLDASVRLSSRGAGVGDWRASAAGIGGYSLAAAPWSDLDDSHSLFAVILLDASVVLRSGRAWRSVHHCT